MAEATGGASPPPTVVVPIFASMYVQVHRPHATKRARPRRKPSITAVTGDARIGDGDAMFGIGTSRLAVDNGADTRCARPALGRLDENGALRLRPAARSSSRPARRPRRTRLHTVRQCRPPCHHGEPASSTAHSSCFSLAKFVLKINPTEV